jgi:hypothetical protein
VKIFATAEGKTQAILTYRGVEKKRKKPKRFLTQIPVDISVTWLDPNRREPRQRPLIMVARIGLVAPIRCFACRLRKE